MRSKQETDRKGQHAHKDERFESPGDYAEWWCAEFLGSYWRATETSEQNGEWLVTLKDVSLSRQDDTQTEVVVYLDDGIYCADQARRWPPFSGHAAQLEDRARTAEIVAEGVRLKLNDAVQELERFYELLNRVYQEAYRPGPETCMRISQALTRYERRLDLRAEAEEQTP